MKITLTRLYFVIFVVLQVGSPIDMDPAIIRKLIYETVLKIKQTVEQVKANENQCKRLGERIDKIASFLNCIDDTDLQKSELRKSLMNFSICVEQCLAFVTKFQGETLWFFKVFSNQNAKDQFKQLNTQLSQCVIDLNLGIHLEEIFDQKQDELDQEKDLNDIQHKLDEIASMMVRQQQEQLHHLQGIEEHIKQRYNSYKHHLEQNISRANDSVKAKKLENEESSFLHIPYYDLVQKECIGHGGFADVYRGRWLSQDHEVAIKVIRIQYLGERAKEEFIKEISTMHRIRYEHVLNMYGACMEPEKYALVVEYMSLGSLFDILRQRTVQFTWSDRWLIALQVTRGINYLHTLPKPIIHRDIKSHNVLMTKSARGFLVKIGDFGLAKIRHETSQQSRSTPVVGTLPWKAPELLKLGKHTEASDVYALGIVFWELATGCEPYEDADDTTISAYVRGGDRMEIPEDVPDSFTELITKAWAQEPKQRPTCQQLLHFVKEQRSEPDKLEETTVRMWCLSSISSFQACL
jgi:tRNA A-37 threonylcarbamoyl transferase component Bud32